MVRCLFRAACAVVCALWAASLTVAVLHVDPAVTVPWWLTLMREPVMSGFLASGTVALIVWKLAAPAGTIWRVAYRCGIEDARTNADEDARGTVVQFQPRQSSYS